eukprot:CAMPEP_0185725902 /NCGR_PEP_ID=MMETSP1171-20130828/2030_1 /TAXON_ID=374046 /ORGANISM="Helicotheca tamensis, Strain CCMP826" /LENGTH=752 /DNA_ID=CAMNT_0028394133 /DNA_START=50 /DNA_END=2305 /DNA_ORIENTATION=+
MKYGQHLLNNIAPEYGPGPYLEYAQLDDVIRILSTEGTASADTTSRVMSLTIPPPTDSKGQVVKDPAKIKAETKNITEETFFSILDREMIKIESFTLAEVTKLRKSLKEIEDSLKSKSIDMTNEVETDALRESTDEIAESFLRLEKYVNINFMGFHKILKKHDKYLPTNPCKSFYVSRLHSQAWVQGDYSDIVVRLSSLYSALRQDHVVQEQQEASQSFLRSTSKYWIKTEDVSRVKYAVLRHLPVFLQKTSTGESDSQLTNSVYLDNDQLELYHSRLDKTPGAIALRLRWYGAGDPKLVFVERKTHRDKWTGEVSVKERFMIDESEVEQVMNGTYPVEEKKQEMMDKLGLTDTEADEWELLARQCMQVISSKQLVPTMRTQYMRTAFQIPFDATVRVSLDTNLCMISERGYDLKNNSVWHRDSQKALAYNEITRFPHAILEVKLELSGENLTPPKWVLDLQNSGMLYEVHKFSKFIHGCSVMMPEDVRCVPYWVDDASVRESIIASGGGRILVRSESEMTESEKKKKHSGVGPGANEVYDHLLPFGDIYHDKTSTAVGRTAQSEAVMKGKMDKTSGAVKGDYGTVFYDDVDEDLLGDVEGGGGGGGDDTCVGWLFPFCSPNNAFYMSVVAPTSVQKIEPKLFFANERTYLHWLHAGTTLYTIAAGILTFAEKKNANWAHFYAMALLPLSLAICIYALHIFLWRADRIKTRIPGRWDDPRGPIILGSALALVLLLNFIGKLFEIARYNRSQW